MITKETLNKDRRELLAAIYAICDEVADPENPEINIEIYLTYDTITRLYYRSGEIFYDARDETNLVSKLSIEDLIEVYDRLVAFND